MRTFDLLRNELLLKRSHQTNIWTTHSLVQHDFERCEVDWGPSHVYHFDKDVSLPDWLDLNNRLIRWIELQPELKNIGIVPFYEIGDDFLVQCKPPYDGGYSTEMYAEFLNHASCQPAPWYFKQIASLHENVMECMNSLGHVDSDPLSKIVHASLIKPNGQLFWADEDGWTLYYGEIESGDIHQPDAG